MRNLIGPFVLVLLGIGSSTPLTRADDDDTKQPVPTTSFGDRDDAVAQNKRFLKVRNETDATLTVYVQFRTPVDGAWKWLPDDPAASTEALSFDIEAGKEIDVTYKDERIAASRMRIWATSPTQQWLGYKTKDAWLVPERTEDGEHVYTSSGVETYTFVFSSDKDKGVIPGDSDMPGEQNLPTDGDNIPLVVPDVQWDDVPDPLPPGFPIIRDLAVLPVSTVGTNATVRVKNLGHFSLNIGRRLMVQKLTPGSLPEDKGPIGPLFHHSVKTFYLVGLAPGNYVAFINPGDDAPYDGNDRKPFTITAASYSDIAVLPVTISGGKANVKVKNVGTAPASGTQHVKVMKLPAGAPIDLGAIGALPVNSIKAFAGVTLPTGNYKAFVTPGDPAPYNLNDQKFFSVAAATHVDLDVLPVVVSAGKATITIKNIGTAPAPAGAHLKITKLPGGPTVDHGPIGPLAVNAVKTFAAIPLAPGNYKAFVSPGDPAPYNGNDAETFTVAAASADLSVSVPSKSAGTVVGTVHNNGPAAYAGARTWHIEKFSGGTWVAIPTVGSHVIPPLAAGASHSIHGTFTGAGIYRIRITPGDSNPGNDVASKMLP
jgi:hypothetical protein